MDENIVRILAGYGCKYMADDNKEMIEEIETYVKNREKQLHIPVVSNRISDSGLRELYRKGYNDGFNNKADDELATDLIDKRIERIKKNYGC